MVNGDDYVKDLEPCPDDEILKSFSFGQIAEERVRGMIESHLRFCAACRLRVERERKAQGLLDDVVRLHAHRLTERMERIQRSKNQGPVLGTLWRTTPPSAEELSGPLVLVIEGEDEAGIGLLRVAEISEDIPQSIESDMILEPQQSGLSFRCMVRAGNVFLTTPNHLKDYAGTIPSSLSREVVEFSSIAKHFDDNVPLSKYVSLRDPAGTKLMKRMGVTSGTLVTQDRDPRLSFLESAKQKCAYLRASIWERLRSLVSDVALTIRVETEASLATATRGGVQGKDAEATQDFSPAVGLAFIVQAGVSGLFGLTSRGGRYKRAPLRLKEGDHILLSLDIPGDGFLVVIHYDGTGRVKFAFPYHAEQDTSVSKGQTKQISGRVQEPPGMQFFKAFWTSHELLEPNSIDFDEDQSVVQAIQRFMDSIQSLETADWREVTYDFEVVPE